MIRLEIKRRAEDDLRDIAAYIARDDPVRAVSFIAELLDRIIQVGTNPFHYRERFAWDRGLRIAHHGRYRILLRANGEDVVILRVVHGSRDLAAVLDDLE